MQLMGGVEGPGVLETRTGTEDKQVIGLDVASRLQEVGRRRLECGVPREVDLLG